MKDLEHIYENDININYFLIHKYNNNVLIKILIMIDLL